MLEPQAVMCKENDQSTAVQAQQWQSTTDLAALEHRPEMSERRVTMRHEASEHWELFQSL